MLLIIRNDDVDITFTREHLHTLQSICSPFRVSMGVVFKGYQTNGFFQESASHRILPEVLENPLWWYLHGLDHVSHGGQHEFERFTTRKCSEFEQLLKEIRTKWGDVPTVFVPPHNHMSPEWLPFLAEHGLNILSSSKRHCRANLEYWNSRQNRRVYSGLVNMEGTVPCGVLNTGKIVEIPQTIMLRRRDFLCNPDYYVNSVCSLLHKLSRHCRVIVLTLHWWEFIGETQAAARFGEALRRLFSTLHTEEFESCSFQQASRLTNTYWAEAELFDEFYGAFTRQEEERLVWS